MSRLGDISIVLRDRLRTCDDCMHCEVGGSIRRGKENPKYIEIVALVQPERDLFEMTDKPTGTLMDALAEDHKTEPRDVRHNPIRRKGKGQGGQDKATQPETTRRV